ncbi:MAG TPA: VOC family protein [Acidimicrobiales bacterium]|nr:VOC family protein [Acidimicrobiales bacterium]
MGATLVRIDHVQLAMPVGAEEAAEAFYGGLLGLHVVAKPEPLASRGGRWFSADPADPTAVALHLGADPDFRPATKAHPAIVVVGLDALVGRLGDAGVALRWDDELPGVRRCHVLDPWGNRIELIDACR